MILNSKRERWLVIGAGAVIGLFALGASVGENADRPGQPAHTSAINEPQAIKTNQRLRELMTERYEILKSMVESLETFFASGRASLSEWRDANIALYAARADLCTEIAQRINIHEEMVGFLLTCEQMARRRADNGVATEVEVRWARLATIEAQMALERLRLSQAQ